MIAVLILAPGYPWNGSVVATDASRTVYLTSAFSPTIPLTIRLLNMPDRQVRIAASPQITSSEAAMAVMDLSTADLDRITHVRVDA